MLAILRELPTDLHHLLLLLRPHPPAEPDPVEAHAEEPGLVSVLVPGPGHAGHHPHVALALVPR